MKVNSKVICSPEVTAHKCSWLRTQDAELSPAERKKNQPAHRIGRNCKTVKSVPCQELEQHVQISY